MRTTRTIITTLVAAIAVVAIAGTAIARQSNNPSEFTVQVAENGLAFAWDEAPVFDDGYPAYGNAFVTQGFVYEDGTLNGTNGVNADGSPEFPDKVVGTWTCYGYFVGNGAYTEEGAWVVTSQIFEFTDDTVGGQTIVTQGFETPQGAGTAVRAVVGGTGDYAAARGDASQVTLGHNATDGVDATFTFNVRGVRG